MENEDWKDYPCILSTNKPDRDGYVRSGQKIAGERREHRIAYAVAYNYTFKPGEQCCHHCDVKICKQPKHLYVGTAAENIADRDKKGRTAKGEKAGPAYLTKEEVEKIRQLPRSANIAEVARRYNVYPSTIHRILDGRTWKKE